MKALNAEIEKIPNLIVIASSDDDQRSWQSEEWRQTIFGHFLNQGVRGAMGQDHPRITAALLFDYLKTEVGNWSRANRDAEQVPILLPTASGKERAEKFEIASIDPGAYRAPAASAAPGTSFTIPNDLRGAWENAQKISQRSPPPETADPVAWRAYLDTILRWEYLVRAGAGTDAIQQQAEALDRDLSRNLFDTDPSCLANSLAVAPAFGIAPAEMDKARFRELWNPLPGKKPEEVWKALADGARASQGENGVTLLRLQAARAVLDVLQQPENGPTAENLDRAAQMLAVVDGSQPRPIETHVLLMLQRDLDAVKRPEPALLLRALRLRIEAERIAWVAGAKDSYGYADQAYRWIEQSLQQADSDRRIGEDLLFAVDKPSWDKATGYFKTAEEKYKQCDVDAHTAAAACSARDVALSRLPYYARWLAGYRGALPSSEIERLLTLVERMAGEAHLLGETLKDVPASPQAKLLELKNLTGTLKAEWAELERAFDADTGNLTGTALPSNWHAIESALSVPFMPVERRTKLLVDQRSISRQLNEKSQTQSSATAATPWNAREMAQRQGRMATALLGERWVEDTDARAAPLGV